MSSHNQQGNIRIDQEEIDVALNKIGRNRDRSVAFGRYRQYIEEINLPRTIRAGDEYVSTTEPLLIIRRNLPVHWEIFQRPYFHVARKIRIKFHWDGLRVLGANMEEPNCFLMPVPFKAGVSSNWFLKLTCQPDCAPGNKSLYVSIEILRENLLLWLLAGCIKIISILSLLTTISLPFLYYASKAVRTYVNSEIGFTGTGTISLAAVIIFSIFILSRHMDDVLPTLMSDANTPPLIKTDSNSKRIMDYAIQVTKAVVTQKR